MRFLEFLSFLLICGQSLSLGLRSLEVLSSLSMDFLNPKTQNDEETLALASADNGFTNYEFLDFVTFPGKKICDADDPHKTLNHIPKSDERRPPVKVKCVAGRGNSTVQVVESMKEALTVLAHHGNSTKRSVEGNCTLILFYAKSCVTSAMAAPFYNALARQFPDIKLAAIDAFKFYSLNTEFGIIGVPTIMLFHQGRPVVRYNETSLSMDALVSFVTRHTGLRSSSRSPHVKSEDFIGPLSNKVEKDPDIYLYMAWAFICICAGYFFTKSKLYTQIIEMIKRNWRESEAQHENGS